MNLASVVPETATERPNCFSIYLLFITYLGYLITQQMILDRQRLPGAHTKKYFDMPPPSAMCAPGQVPPRWASPPPLLIPGYATDSDHCLHGYRMYDGGWGGGDSGPERNGRRPREAQTPAGRCYQCTVGRIGILARRGMFASFFGPLLHNHNHVAHASIAGESGKR